MDRCRKYFPGKRLCIVIIIWNILTLSASMEQIRVAAIFESQFDGMCLAFKNAITKVNLHAEAGAGRSIIYENKTIALDDSYEAQRELCLEMRRREGIAAVFGQTSKTSQAHMQLICNATEIPHIEAAWNPHASRQMFSISIYPNNEELNEAFADIIKHWQWKVFTVIYEDKNSLIRLQKILEIANGENFKMTIRQLDTSERTYRSKLGKLLQEMKLEKEYRVVIDCHVTKIQAFLEVASDMTMLSEYYHYHFTTMDLTQVYLEPFRYKGANITSMRLIDPANPNVTKVMEEWGLREANYGRSPLLGTRFIGTETALMYDAVNMYAHAMHGLARAQTISTESINCHKRETWKNGTHLLNYLKTFTVLYKTVIRNGSDTFTVPDERHLDILFNGVRSMYDGLSGRIKFDDGKRKDFSLGVVSLTRQGLIEVGNWNKKNGINVTAVEAVKKVQDDKERLKNITLRVVTVYDPPYVTKLSEPNEHGRMHEGFIIDLLDELSAILGFNYTIYQAADKNYGSKVSPAKWNGMIGDLMERDSVKKADIAAAGLTITYARAKVVDFSMPFLNLGITIIYKRPVDSPPDLFSFLLPLSPDVWIYMIAAYLCVSFMMFLIARFSPYEWENPHPCNQESEERENEFTILNCLWFSIGSLMQQGSDIAPKASSTRCIASIWYLFTLIIVSSYTANLAAFLTRSRMDAPITNAEDLSLQTDIQYGTLGAGSTRDFFKNSKVPTFKRMDAFMSANEEGVMVDGNADGFKRVKASHKYAFLAESTSIDYQVQRNCDLMQIGDLLDSKGYGLAAPKDSPWIGYISKEIVNLQQRQVLAKMYTRWWVEKSDTLCEKDKSEEKTTNALGVANLGGVFVVLAGGSIFAFFVSILEFIWKVGKNARDDDIRFWSEMKRNLRFIFLKCKSSRNTAKEETEGISIGDGADGKEKNGVALNAVNDRHRDK